MAGEKVRRIFLCRHGKTEANEKGVYCGGLNDSPLTEMGKTQAKLLARWLKNYYRFYGRFIFTSNLKRAIETAGIIARNFEPSPFVLQMDGLKELNLGKWCGKRAEEIQILFPEEHKKWLKGDLGRDFRFPGGESMKESRERIVPCFNLIKKLWLGDESESNNDLIILVHGGVNMVILAEIMNMDIKKHGYRTIRQDNACINIICFCEGSVWRPKMQVTLLNSVHHLDCVL